MMRNKLIIGLTGGSGCGKSVFASAGKELGFKHIDTDEIAHNIILKDKPAHLKIINEFGNLILDSFNEIDRKKLAEIVFNDNAKLNTLNKIMHPIIAEEIKSQINDYSIIDAPVLYKTPYIKDMCNITVAVLNKKERRIEFVCKRDNISKEQAIIRINNQPKDEFYLDYADIIINNDGTEEELYNKSIKTIKELLG